ncbi:vacuolar protein sorting-associated protein 36 [Tanacetum coccineum]
MIQNFLHDNSEVIHLALNVKMFLDVMGVSSLNGIAPLAGGVLYMIDIYCLFNHARGTELISPNDLLRACSLFADAY